MAVGTVAATTMVYVPAALTGPAKDQRQRDFQAVMTSALRNGWKLAKIAATLRSLLGL